MGMCCKSNINLFDICCFKCVIAVNMTLLVPAERTACRPRTLATRVSGPGFRGAVLYVVRHDGDLVQYTIMLLDR